MKHFTYFILCFMLVFCSCKDKKASTNSKNNKMIENGIITKTSNFTFENTYNNLKGIIENNPNLKIILELDHSKNAASKGLELIPTKIIMFGNPNLGTPLMQNNPIIGLDLPQKILVFEDATGNVKVSYNNPLYLKNRHDIIDKDAIINKISGALDKITTAAITKN